MLASRDWIQARNQRIQSEVIYVGFATAFDVACHRRLLAELRVYSVTGALLNWLVAHLLGRSFRVRVGDAFSDEFQIISGVPQGSVLDPFLFLVFINGLPDSIQSPCKIFAEDVKIYRPIRYPVIDFLTLQDDLDSLSGWSHT